MSKNTKQDGGRYPAAKGGVPMEDWVVERVFDSADYLDRKPPRYADAGKPAGKAGKAVAEAAMLVLEAPDAQPPTQAEREELHALHGDVATGVSLKRDKDGLFVHTHRARSKSFKSVAAIPKTVVRFIESTG